MLLYELVPTEDAPSSRVEQSFNEISETVMKLNACFAWSNYSSVFLFSTNNHARTPHRTGLLSTLALAGVEVLINSHYRLLSLVPPLIDSRPTPPPPHRRSSPSGHLGHI